MNTIRSDVAKLAATGAVEKIYGGVRILSTQEVPLFTHRSDLHADSKRRIAQYAQNLIQDNDTLYIDPGTTTMHLMDFLSPAKHVTIITGNASILSRASAFPNVELIVLPGLLNRRTNSVADVSTLEFLGRYRCAKAFLGSVVRLNSSWSEDRNYLSALGLMRGICLSHSLPPSTGISNRQLKLLAASLHPQTLACSAGIFACCPSPMLAASA